MTRGVVIDYSSETSELTPDIDHGNVLVIYSLWPMKVKVHLPQLYVALFSILGFPIKPFGLLAVVKN